MIYLDHAATTRVHPAVLEVMLPFLNDHFGNASSMHAFGRTSKNALNQARDTIARVLQCSPGELIFTGSGTESDNMALFGCAFINKEQTGKNHIIVSQIEHHAVLNAAEHLQKLGFDVTFVPVDHTGIVQVDQIAAAIRPNTSLISVMYANNEVGTLQNIEEIGVLAEQNNVYFHVDAVQSLGSVDIQLHSLPVDFMSFSAHKINGPKGVGLLYVRQKTPFQPYIFGGSQERGRRAGTENVAGIVGFAKAIELATNNLPDKQLQYEQYRQLFIQILTQQIGSESFSINGHETKRLPHILNVSFYGIDSETMLINLDMNGIAASSGSACTSGSLEVSHVLKAMKQTDEVLSSAVRFSFGSENNEKQIADAAQIIATIVNRLRK